GEGPARVGRAAADVPPVGRRGRLRPPPPGPGGTAARPAGSLLAVAAGGLPLPHRAARRSGLRPVPCLPARGLGLLPGEQRRHAHGGGRPPGAPGPPAPPARDPAVAAPADPAPVRRLRPRPLPPL